MYKLVAAIFITICALTQSVIYDLRADENKKTLKIKSITTKKIDKVQIR